LFWNWRSGCEEECGCITGSNGAERSETANRQVARRAEQSDGNQARTRRRNLIKLGADPAEVKLASRSRKGYWRMSSNRILQQALTNHWLEEHGVPSMRTLWIKLHYGPKARV